MQNALQIFTTFLAAGLLYAFNPLNLFIALNILTALNLLIARGATDCGTFYSLSPQGFEK